MEPGEIKAKRAEIANRLKAHDAARKLIEAEVLALQHVCEHPKARWVPDTFGDGSSWHCPDCGLNRG